MKRLYLGKAAEVFCLLDDEDHAWAQKWRWGITWDRDKKKMYATRNTRLHGRKGKQTKIYLHKSVLQRKGVPPPSPKHTIGDHMDGDSLNNQRANLIWETPEGNARNRFGSRVKQPELAAGADDVPF